MIITKHKDNTTDTETNADELYQELIPDDHADQTITPDDPFLINMTNPAVAIAKEIKIASPTPFTGDPEKTRKFLQDVELYIHINSALYDTDEKIIFALSFMKGGTAVGWSESYINAALTASNFGAWDDFKKEIEKAFSPINSEGTARLKLKYLKQGEKQPVDEYISQFRILVSKCGITDNKALVNYFMDGLTRKLLEKIHLPHATHAYYYR